MDTMIRQAIEKIKDSGMSIEEREAQRRSFAFGSANIENSRITRDTVKKAENLLKEEAKSSKK
ncbi:hypothetical protein [Pleomorphomonas carboxyditropha]|uniref:Uncharacterized protein n=1 Tax=Pleomorphomonas carboxyditropha TaxID=2023338 RepID=A0A2G9WS53_9HYPH|nr:hypothetical protein [Pleomorphomonas carboxyditropha]PIO97513.1 hypothetical protein CJ014_19915 [Pleomorphomonas carboxyditropha]